MIAPRLVRVVLPILFGLHLATGSAEADGGRIVWSGARGGVSAAIIVSPAAPRVGGIRVDWVGPASSEGVVSAMHENGLRESGPMMPRGDEHEVTLDLLAPGVWHLFVDPDGDGGLEAVEISIELGPPLPAWRSQWPWLLAWIPMVVVGLYAGFRRRRAGPV